MKILKAHQMAEVDRLTTERFHIPSILLMENAGRAVTDELERVCPDLSQKKVLVICGTGNNGGDGLVVARHLVSRGFRPEVWILGDPSRFRGDALANWQIFQQLEVPFKVLSDTRQRNRLLGRTRPPEVIIDALFGTGLSKPIGADLRRAVDWVNSARNRSLIMSVDIPSGIFADSAEVPGPAIQADHTVTFTAPKPALIFPPAADRAGKVTVAPIGSPLSLLDHPDYGMELVDSALVRRVLPARRRDSHKGSYGHVFALAGSSDKSGAALMTGIAALRSGAGLVTLMLPVSLRKYLIGKVPEIMCVWLPETGDGTSDASAGPRVLEQLSQADVVVIGPGLSTNPSTRQLVRQTVRKAPVPVILDADGINAFAGSPEALVNEQGHPIAITPHPGEMARLLGRKIAGIQRSRLQTAQEFSRTRGMFTVLKGFQTVVGTPGGRLLINPTGNPGMATGGTGDILAGMAGRFAAAWKLSGSAPESLGDYLAAAVHLHGLAGDLAAARKGEEGLAAMDLVDHLPGAFATVGRK